MDVGEDEAWSDKEDFGFRSPIEKGISLVARIFTGVVKIAKVIATPILYIAGGIMLFSLLMTWLGLTAGSVFVLPHMDFFTFGPDVLGFVSLFNAVFIFGIPLLIVVLSITKYIFKFKVNKAVTISLIVFAIINFFSLASIGIHTAKDFQSEVTVESKFVGDLPSSDTIHLHFPRSHGHSHSYTIELGDDARIKDDQLLIRSVDVNLKKATDNLLSLRLEKSGRGSNSVVANDYLDYMDSNISVEGNHIYIPQSYSISKGGKFRAQNLEVTINIPEGKHIVFDKNIRSYHLNRVDMAEGYKRRFRNQNATWKMTKDGLANNLTAEESNNSTSASQVSISLSATKGIDINVSSEED